MAWKNLQEDLGELFDQLTSRADELLDALERRRQYENAYMRTYWRDNPGKYAAHLRRMRVANKARRAEMSDEEREAYNAAGRERARRSKAARKAQRLIVPMTSTASIAPAS